MAIEPVLVETKRLPADKRLFAQIAVVTALHFGWPARRNLVQAMLSSCVNGLAVEVNGPHNSQCTQMIAFPNQSIVVVRAYES